MAPGHILPEGYETRILWNGTSIKNAIMKEAVAGDFDKVFGEGKVPNQIEYKMFLEFREALKTVTVLEDMVKQYELTDVNLPLISEFIHELKTKHDMYAKEEKINKQSN